MKPMRIAALAACLALLAGTVDARPLKLKPANPQPDAVTQGLSVSYAYPDAVKSLRDAYIAKLTERRARLADMAQGAGWQFATHRTSESPRKALLWLYTLISGVR